MRKTRKTTPQSQSPQPAAQIVLYTILPCKTNDVLLEALEVEDKENSATSTLTRSLIRLFTHFALRNKNKRNKEENARFPAPFL